MSRSCTFRRRGPRPCKHYLVLLDRASTIVSRPRRPPVSACLLLPPLPPLARLSPHRRRRRCRLSPRHRRRRRCRLRHRDCRPPRCQDSTIWLCNLLLQARADAQIMMAALYKARDLAQYVPEPIPSKEFRTVTGRSHPSSAQGVWSEWVTEEVPQLTPASMLMPLVDALPPPDMRLPPKPIRRLDPAAVRHFNLQAVVGAPPPATAIDGGPLPAQASAAMASREATSSSLSGRSSADGSQKPASKAEIISQLALSLSEARPKVSGASRLHSRPRHATHPPWVTPESPYISTRACMPART